MKFGDIQDCAVCECRLHLEDVHEKPYGFVDGLGWVCDEHSVTEKMNVIEMLVCENCGHSLPKGRTDYCSLECEAHGRWREASNVGVA